MLNPFACVMTALGLGVLAALGQDQEAAGFRARAVRRTATLQLKASLEEIFPLFDPVHEAQWVEGWEIEVVHPRDASPAQGMVFRTHLAPEGETVWLLTRFDVRSGEVEYVNVTPGLKLTRINIHCRRAGEAATEAEVVYTVTALSERGNQYVEAFDAKYSTWLPAWEEAINYYLRTGKQLPHQG